MDAKVRDVMTECTDASDQERMSFPEIVGRLVAAGVERYHADLLRGEKTYYLPDGESLAVPAQRVAAVPAPEFAPAGVEAAVRAIQAGQVGYGEFCRRIMESGCVGYIVSIAGRRAVYFGRTAECYVEPFPPAPQDPPRPAH